MNYNTDTLFFVFLIISTYFIISAFNYYREIQTKYNIKKEKGKSLKYLVDKTGNNDAIKILRRAVWFVRLGILAIIAAVCFLFM